MSQQLETKGLYHENKSNHASARYHGQSTGEGQLMGLDMFARGTREMVASYVDFEVKAYAPVHSWRKHPDLHGWMANLYYEKGGVEEFNGVPVELDNEDLERLEHAVANGLLPTTSGFFFGSSDGTEVEGDLLFIAKTRKMIALRYTIYCLSSW